MDLKAIHKQLKTLHDRIKKQGHMSASDEQELKSLMRETLDTAGAEMDSIKTRLHIQMSASVSDRPLSPEQISRLSIVEKTGTGSTLIH